MTTGIVAYDITNLFFTASQTSEFSKKEMFQFDLDTGLASAEIAPGDSFSVSPVIYNDATEEMSTNSADAWNECKTLGGIQ